MIVKQIVTGFVVQVYDTATNKFISQDFVGDETSITNENGDEIDSVNFKDTLPLLMIQPD
jgi:hypothetical protein